MSERSHKTDTLSKQSLRLTELAENKELGLSASIVDWGIEIPSSLLKNKIAQHLAQFGDPPEISLPGVTGFATHHWTEGQITFEELKELQTEAAVKAVTEALDIQHILPDELERLAVTTSIPANPELAVDIANRIGIPTERAELCVAACFSSDYMFNRFVTDAAKYPGPQAIIGIETVTAFRNPILDGPKHYQRGITDIPSLSFFSDRAGAVVFDPRRFKLIHQTTHGKADTQGVLGCTRVVSNEGNEIQGYDSVILENGQVTIATVPDPRPDQAVFMDPGGTTRLFVTFLKQLTQKFKDEYAQTQGKEFSPDMITKAMCHHPSVLLHGLLTKVLELPANTAPFVSTHCNSPAVTFQMEAARVFPNLVRGDKLMTVFFGAGVAGAINIYEID